MDEVLVGICQHLEHQRGTVLGRQPNAASGSQPGLTEEGGGVEAAVEEVL